MSPTDTSGPFPSPFGFYIPQSTEMARCYFCHDVHAVPDMAAVPLGYFRTSVDISPTWQKDGEVKARALLPKDFPRHFRPPYIKGAPYVCKCCWLTCCQVDQVVQECGESFGNPWDEPPISPFGPM